jgi:hypothetical protein
MRRNDFEAIVRFDIEALRRFLRDENNAKKLNLNALCIVGAEMGAIAAARWTALDWSAPPLPVGKQGQDVKAMVLISPPWTYQSIPMAPALNHELVRSNVSLLVLAGARNSDAVRNARRTINAVERFHNEPADPAQEEVISLTWDTTLQGTQLLAAAELKVDEPILQFIKRRVAEQAFPWSPRIALVSSQ